MCYLDKISGFAVFYIFIIIIATGLLLHDLYISHNHGKNIIKIKENRVLTIFWMVSLIFWCLLSYFGIIFYIENGKNGAINNILNNIFWIEFSILNVKKSYRGSEIRENGVYKSGYFYKWNKIKSYSWVSPNTIEFKANANFRANTSLKFTINEEFKLKVDEVIKRKLVL